jgi:hypothetical protein
MNEITNDLFLRTSHRIGVRRREFLLRAVSTGAVIAGAPRYQEAAALQTATNREPSRFQLPKVVNVSDNGRTVVVETIGAMFTLHRSNPGLIELTQKINGPRVLCQMEWDTSFADLTINFHDQDDFVSYIPAKGDGFSIRIFGDSLLSARVGKVVNVRTQGQWLPEYSDSEAGYLLFLDRQGGYGQYHLPTRNDPNTYADEAPHGLSFTSRG